jgi:hypothetical protein
MYLQAKNNFCISHVPIQPVSGTQKLCWIRTGRVRCLEHTGEKWMPFQTLFCFPRNILVKHTIGDWVLPQYLILPTYPELYHLQSHQGPSCNLLSMWFDNSLQYIKHILLFIKKTIVLVFKYNNDSDLFFSVCLDWVSEWVIVV